MNGLTRAAMFLGHATFWLGVASSAFLIIAVFAMWSETGVFVSLVLLVLFVCWGIGFLLLDRWLTRLQRRLRAGWRPPLPAWLAPARAKPVALPAPATDEAQQVARASRALRERVRSAGPALPSSIATRATAALDVVDTLTPRWESDLRGRAEERQIIEQIVNEYLPTALGGYLALPASYLERTGSSVQTQVAGQLDLLTTTLRGIQDDVYGGVVERLQAQSDFLRQKFPQGGSLQL